MTPSYQPWLSSIAFLGPQGTFADSALAALESVSDIPSISADSVPKAFESVRSEQVDAALVPIENSVEGSVSVTLDELNGTTDLVILDEVVVPVQFALVGLPGKKLDEVQAVGTHPHAAAQCRAWLARNLPQAQTIPTMSTAGAAATMLAQDVPYDAAIVPPIAAKRYPVEVLAPDIADNPEAWTRFVLVARPGHLPAKTGNDKTSLVLFIRANQSGALLEILTELGVRGVNLTRIESRPTRRVLGEYSFSVDLEGHLADARVGEALMGLKRVCADVRFLGSYPQHTLVHDAPPARVTDMDYANAANWLAALGGHARTNE
jgi:prephenate dehydratase